MQGSFEEIIKSIKSEIAALKADKIKAAQTLTVKEWTTPASVQIVGWMPQKTIRITITPTSPTTPNILTSVCGTNSDHVFRTLRTASGTSTVYYISWIGHLDWQDGVENETIDTTISVRYTAPANITMDYVDNIYGY